jgi:selenide,water dikinase
VAPSAPGAPFVHSGIAACSRATCGRAAAATGAGDDAGVIYLSEDRATILTVDVFCPSVDDPYTFGQIAAANSVSDIYAMGGKPEVALSIIGFPIDSLPAEAMREILRGGVEKMREARICVIGGHSINDAEVKCGFAVVGIN